MFSLIVWILFLKCRSDSLVAVTDIGVTSILRHCTRLEEAVFAGLKQISSDAFLPMISSKLVPLKLKTHVEQRGGTGIRHWSQ